MISQLKGIVDSISLSKVTIDVGGVGYEVNCSARCLANLEIGKPTLVTIYTHVREDALVLFGFEDSLEKQVFLLLISVQGVGPKSGAEIISKIDKLDLLRTISTGDATQLQKIKGVGKKLSERIIVELKDRVSDFVQGRTERVTLEPANGLIDDSVEDAIAAMCALGFQRKDAEKAVKQTVAGGGINGRDSGQLVRDALRFV